MILVAFVLVLVATVTLVIGTFFDAGTQYIWISIVACLATFVVLAISYYARRRSETSETARPAPLATGTSREAPSRPAPARSTTVGGGTATLEKTDVEDEDASPTDDDATVTIVPGDRAGAPVPVDATDEGDADEGEAPSSVMPPQPAPRRVAPRRVVRRAAPVAAATEPEEAEDTAPEPEPEVAPAQPEVATAPTETVPDEASEVAPTGTEDTPAPTTRKVVRRVRPSEGGDRTVVRRVARPGDGGQPTTRVVRRVAGQGGATPQRQVRKVVRRAPAAGSAAGAATTAAATPARKTPDRSGTRGQKARAVLSEIKGVGPAKQDALLRRFGSLEKMAEASVEELAEVKGVGEAVAEQIKSTLQAR